MAERNKGKKKKRKKKRKTERKEEAAGGRRSKTANPPRTRRIRDATRSEKRTGDGRRSAGE